ncbi:FitA-like ribbon-helix-helix domain-containing protein [Nitrospira sp. M1]
MPTNLLIKDVPDRLMARLRLQAVKHHRSLQGEVVAIIESSVETHTPLTPSQVLAQVRLLGLKTPREAASIIRRDRNS